MVGAHKRHARAFMAKIIGAGATVVALAVGLVAAPPAAALPAGPAAETGIVAMADLSKFRPGNIISDAVFFNRATMTEAQIQAFLQSKGGTCRSGYTCLKDYYDTSRTTTADAMCGAYSGGVRERASRIIYKVAQACGINPQVLLVMLQKEQGLVTSTAPSAYNYRAAMGQGCPDTAACDTRYYGFFNQLYGGAWQLKRYANPPGTSQFFTWYAPGKTWNVLFHPNRACGTSPVFVENQATANLYYYTPYQPNAAALRAGYGTGDGCSSYGNRNFFNYFTDWFGSTQRLSANLIQAGPDVFLVSGANRYGVGPSLLQEYRSVFGAVLPVSADYAAIFTLRGVASPFIRNTSTGEVAFVQGGQKHWFGSCSLVAAWGGACDQEVRLEAADYTRVPAGAKMTWFARLAAGGPAHMIEGSTLSPVYDAGTAQMLNGGTAPYAAVMSTANASRYEVGAVRFADGKFIRTDESTRVYLPTADDRLVYLPSWHVAVELGLPLGLYRTVPVSATEGYTQSGELGVFVACNGTTGIAAGGRVHPVTPEAATGFTVTTLDPGACGALSRVSASPLGKIFVQGTGSSAIYVAENGVFRHVTSPSALLEMGGGVRPPVLQMSAAMVDRLPKGEPVRASALPVGQFVRAQSSPRVYFATADRRLLYLPAWSLAQELGLPRTDPKVLDGAQLAQFTYAEALSLVVKCGAQTYFASQGTLVPATDAAAAGLSSATLDATTCARFSRATTAPLPDILVQSTSGTAVYLARSGSFHHITSPSYLLSLGGGTRPTVLRLSPDTVARLPLGAPMP